MTTPETIRPASSAGWVLLALYAGAVAVRGLTLVASHTPVPDGDWPVYARVAENILSGCGVSLSMPGHDVCVPHFGGNGLPGYPVFIAAVWSVTMHTKIAVLWAQVFAAALGTPVLARAARVLAGRRAGLLCGLVAAVSPLQASLVRYGGAECLTVAVAELLMAELLLSIATGRLRTLPIAACLSLGIFLRLDFGAFAAAVAVVGIAIEGLTRAVWRGVLLAALLCLPLGAWTARNLAEGVALLPPARGWMLPDGQVGPLGYKAWLAQWVVTGEQRAAAMFFEGDRYDKIRWLPGAFRDTEQDAAAEALLDELREHTGHPFPGYVDAGFAELARQTALHRSAIREAALHAAQAWGFWQSWAEPLPPELRPQGGMPMHLVVLWFEKAMLGGVGSAINVATRFYRLVLGVGLIGVSIAWPCWGRTARIMVLATVALALVKTLIGVVGLFIEPRYTLSVVPAVELTLVLCVLDLARRSEVARVAG